MHKGVIIQTPSLDKVVVCRIKYELSDNIKNAASRKEFENQNVVLHYKKLREKSDRLILRDKVYTLELDALDDLHW